jgi:uncharacterized RDD family membrane protein YckC
MMARGQGDVEPLRLGVDGVAEIPAGEATEALPGGFWLRALALSCDLLVITFLVGLGELGARLLGRLDVLAHAFSIAYRLVIPGAYLVLGHGTAGQTLGKWLVGVRVEGATGEPIGYRQAIGRLAAFCLAAALGGVGLLIAGVRADRRGLHDLLAGTRVVRTR